ncbi:MAG: endonuclease [Lentimicrobiaceae bacterium]|nr:endonuclease [Lentimicrobiaceae bacterium]
MKIGVTGLVPKASVLLAAFLAFVLSGKPQQTEDRFSRDSTTLRVCFYNLENFFDYEHNPQKNDADFTPEGKYHWTKTRYGTKVNNIAKVFIAMGGGISPEIIGVCEIENEKAISDLLYRSPLKSQGYRYVHYPTPDRRGIGISLFYKAKNFEVVYSKAIPIVDSTNAAFQTRDILYVKGLWTDRCSDTLHLFVNHFPSRYGGYAVSMGKRVLAAKTLRSAVDSILWIDGKAKILIMGDFNDYPYDENIVKYLQVPYQRNKNDTATFVNTMFSYFSKNNVGTHKYAGHWGILDQIIVSPALYFSTSGLRTKGNGVIFDIDFLLEKDASNMGVKPFRTYSGFSYKGGFSDHLPVFIDLICY